MRKLFVTFFACTLIGCGQSDTAYAPSTRAPSQSIESVSSPPPPTQNESVSYGPSDPSGLGHRFVSEIEGFLQNRETDSILGLLLSAVLAEAANNEFTIEAMRRAVKEINISNIENGKVEWKGRLLPSAIITVEISTVNRAAGLYGTECIIHAAIKDEEFGVIRDYFYDSCKESEGKISEWKKRNKFPDTQLQVIKQ